MNFLLPYNYQYVLEELVLTESEADLAEQVHRMLNDGINSRHRDIFDGVDDEDEDDE